MLTVTQLRQFNSFCACCFLTNLMNSLFLCFFQPKKKQKEKHVSSVLVNDEIIGMITMATPQEIQKIVKEKREKNKKQEGQEKEDKWNDDKSKVIETTVEKQKTKQEKMEQNQKMKESKEENQGEQEKSTAVRKRNKRHLRVTIAPDAVTFESAKKVNHHLLIFSKLSPILIKRCLRKW